MMVLSAKPASSSAVDEPPHRAVDPADHAVVRPHVRLVLRLGVPTPEVARSIDGRLQEVGKCIEDRGIPQSRRSNLDVLVHAVDRPGPRKMADAWPTITVLGVTGVEPHVQGEGLTLRVASSKNSIPRSTINSVSCRRLPSGWSL